MPVDYDALALKIKERDKALNGVARWQEKVAEIETELAAILAGEELPQVVAAATGTAVPADYAETAQ